MHIVIPDADTVTRGDLPLDGLRELGELTVYPHTAPEELPQRLAEADAILCNKTKMNADTLRLAERVRFIGLFATGYDNVDLAYTAARGITVCNAGSYSTEAVAQHVWALILDRYSHVAEYDRFVHDGGWVNSTTFSPFVFAADELCGKTIGLIGYGHIGRAVARIARAFGLTVLVHTRTPGTDPDVTFVSLSRLLAQADILSLHCPLTPQTRGLLDDAAFALCKRGALLINTARGPIVDEAALCRALESGQLSGAAVDVLETEPMSADCPLLHAPNCVITPHVAWAPLTTRQRLLGIVTDNLRQFLRGTPVNVVQGGQCPQTSR